MELAIGVALGAALAVPALLAGISVGRSLSRSSLEAAQAVMKASEALSASIRSSAETAAMAWKTGEHLEKASMWMKASQESQDKLAAQVLVMKEIMQETMMTRRGPSPARTVTPPAPQYPTLKVPEGVTLREGGHPEP